MKRKYVLCDIDHVLSNAWWRDPMIGGEGGWDAYHLEGDKDEPIHDIVHLLNALHDDGYAIVLLTARPEKWRKLTMTWLVRHGVNVDEMLMRPDANFDPSPKCKLDQVKARFADPTDAIAMVIEDRDDICNVFRELGVTVLQVFGRQK